MYVPGNMHIFFLFFFISIFDLNGGITQQTASENIHYD